VAWKKSMEGSTCTQCLIPHWRSPFEKWNIGGNSTRSRGGKEDLNILTRVAKGQKKTMCEGEDASVWD